MIRVLIASKLFLVTFPPGDMLMIWVSVF